MIAITGGGTGGHIFPIVAVIQELKERGYQDFMWIGQKGGKEEYWAKKIGVKFVGIPSGKLRRYFSIKNFFDLFNIFAGFIKSLIILKKVKIDILFSKGGFISVPPVIAAKLYNIPVVTHESDITPGLANKINARFAKTIFVSFEETKKYFKNHKVILTGNPIRKEVKNGDPKKGREFLGLKKKIPIVIVIGGSLGAASINRVVWEMIKKYTLEFFLIHQCGPGNKSENFDFKDKTKGRYLQVEFIEKEIGDVLIASDLVVSRAGAGAIYEIGYLAKPAIFIPLPLSGSRGEQIKNALYLKSKNAAEIIRDEELNSKVLYKKITELLLRDDLRERMSRNIEALIIKNGEKRIADEILKIVS